MFQTLRDLGSTMANTSRPTTPALSSRAIWEGGSRKCRSFLLQGTRGKKIIAIEAEKNKLLYLFDQVDKTNLFNGLKTLSPCLKVGISFAVLSDMCQM